MFVCHYFENLRTYDVNDIINLYTVQDDLLDYICDRLIRENVRNIIIIQNIYDFVGEKLDHGSKYFEHNVNEIKRIDKLLGYVVKLCTHYNCKVTSNESVANSVIIKRHFTLKYICRLLHLRNYTSNIRAFRTNIMQPILDELR